MPQSGSSPARTIVLVVLLVVSLGLAGVYTQEGQEGPLHSVQTKVMSVTGRISGVGAGLGTAASAANDAVDNVTANPETLSGLREQNEQLRQLLAETEEYRQEVDRLRDLLDMKQVSGVSGPIAHVIGRSTTAWDQSVTIDLGSADGVSSGMTIMGATGVIGQVSRAAEHTSTVRLLTDPNSGAAVMVQSTRANGIVRGSLSGLLYLEDIDEDKTPEVGDVILTSGLGGSYERGLIVGAVVSVGDATFGGGSIVVNPNDSAEVLEEVIVVFKAPSSPSSQTEVGADGQVQSDDVTAVETPETTSYSSEEQVYSEG